MADMLKIVRGISQAVANSHDGAIDENGDPVLNGLKREEAVPIIDKRVMDGFNVSFYGDQLWSTITARRLAKKHTKS